MIPDTKYSNMSKKYPIFTNSFLHKSNNFPTPQKKPYKLGCPTPNISLISLSSTSIIPLHLQVHSHQHDFRWFLVRLRDQSLPLLFPRHTTHKISMLFFLEYVNQSRSPCYEWRRGRVLQGLSTSSHFGSRWCRWGYSFCHPQVFPLFIIVSSWYKTNTEKM